MLDLPNHSLPFGVVIKKGVTFYTQIFATCFSPIVCMAILYTLPRLYFSQLDKSFLINVCLVILTAYVGLAPYILALDRAKSVLTGNADEYKLSPLKVIQKYYFTALLAFTLMLLPMFGFIFISFFAQKINAMIALLSFPVAYILLLLSFGVVLVVLDDTESITAIKQSIQIVYGRWWRTFGVIFVALSLPQLAVSLLTIVLSFGIPWLAEFIRVLGIIAILPLSIATLIVLSHDLKQRYREDSEQAKFEAEQISKEI